MATINEVEITCPICERFHKLSPKPKKDINVVKQKRLCCEHLNTISCKTTDCEHFVYVFDGHEPNEPYCFSCVSKKIHCRVCDILFMPSNVSRWHRPSPNQACLLCNTYMKTSDHPDFHTVKKLKITLVSVSTLFHSENRTHTVTERSTCKYYPIVAKFFDDSTNTIIKGMSMYPESQKLEPEITTYKNESRMRYYILTVVDITE